VSNRWVTIYRERLWPAPWLYIATALVIPASLLVFLPINFWVGVATAVVLYAGCVALLVASAPLVAVTETEFLAGRARLPLTAVGAVAGYRGSDASLERGQRLDARAYLVIRGWVDPVVRVELDDASDPTPYWLVSTRRPDELVAALGRASD
jgi:hypothetical protein